MAAEVRKLCFGFGYSATIAKEQAGPKGHSQCHDDKPCNSSKRLCCIWMISGLWPEMYFVFFGFIILSIVLHFSLCVCVCVCVSVCVCDCVFEHMCAGFVFFSSSSFFPSLDSVLFSLDSILDFISDDIDCLLYFTSIQSLLHRNDKIFIHGYTWYSALLVHLLCGQWSDCLYSHSREEARRERLSHFGSVCCFCFPGRR